MEVFISNSVHDTYNIAEKLSKDFNSGDIIFLDGDLGAGKTAFVKGVVKAFGGNENEAVSPTFTIVNEYKVNGKIIYHFDLYRIENSEELYNIGIEEYLYSGAICFIEWPERAKDLFDFKHKSVIIEKLSDIARKITYKGETKWKH